MRTLFTLRNLAAASAIGLGASLVIAPTAAFAYNDSFLVETTNGCGSAEFIDYGEGAPGGGNNDDYMVVHDYCADGRGVAAVVYLNGSYWASTYNSNGAAGAAKIWDPFQSWNEADLRAGDRIKVEVSLLENASSENGLYLRSSGYRTIVDG